MIMPLISPGVIVNFELLTPALGTGLTGKFLGEMSADIISTFGFIPDDMHRRIYSSLPDGTVLDDAYSYSYMLFESTNGDKVCYGTPWIDPTSVAVIEDDIRYVIEIVGGPSIPTIIKQQLNEVGIFEYSISNS